MLLPRLQIVELFRNVECGEKKDVIPLVVQLAACPILSAIGAQTEKLH